MACIEVFCNSHSGFLLEFRGDISFHVGACDYGGHCLKLAQLIKANTPEAEVLCKRGRQGSFEISINEKLIYSKLQTMALPDYEEVTEVVKEAAMGGEIRPIRKQQPIECIIL